MSETVVTNNSSIEVIKSRYTLPFKAAFYECKDAGMLDIILNLPAYKSNKGINTKILFLLNFDFLIRNFFAIF